MPFGFGEYEAGVVCTPAFRSVIAEYLHQTGTVVLTEWQWNVPRVDVIHHLAPMNVVLVDVELQDTPVWSGRIVAQAGLTCLIEVQAIKVTGDGRVSPTVWVPTDLNDGGGRHQSHFQYAPYPPFPSLPTLPWVATPRSDPTAWDSPTGDDEAWIALPGVVAVGSWASADGITPPFIPQLDGLANWVFLPKLYILAVALPQGKVGAPLVLTPMAWEGIYESEILPTETDVWQSIRNQCNPWLEQTEQGDGSIFGLEPTAFQVDAPSWFRQGRAGVDNLTLR